MACVLDIKSQSYTEIDITGIDSIAQSPVNSVGIWRDFPYLALFKTSSDINAEDRNRIVFYDVKFGGRVGEIRLGGPSMSRGTAFKWLIARKQPYVLFLQGDRLAIYALLKPTSAGGPK